ncbi:MULTISPECIES: hypothetical protein [Cronobacter]|uniref:hypothetical protein n=1 Tax=Cronobacter TaxID=413496 RepID=UPI00100DA8C3|nr:MULTISPECIES: hypothetical protein [Cronobacter]NUW57581.1 hypothetical protein [Cronobacter turicensis]
MNTVEAENIIYKLLLSDKSLPIRVRSKLPWDESEFNELLGAVDFLIDAWAGSKTVPKFIALAFVDIYGIFNLKDGFYPSERLNFLEDMGIALQEKASELFS